MTDPSKLQPKFKVLSPPQYSKYRHNRAWCILFDGEGVIVAESNSVAHIDAGAEIAVDARDGRFCVSLEVNPGEEDERHFQTAQGAIEGAIDWLVWRSAVSLAVEFNRYLLKGAIQALPEWGESSAV